MNLIVFVVVLSIAVQLWAAIKALRLIRITGRRTGWLLIAIALVLMTIRRAESLLRALEGGEVASGDLFFEINGLLLSLLMFAGIWRIAPVFQELADSREELRDVNKALAIVTQEQKQLLDYSTDFIYRHDLLGNISFASPAVARITGFSPQEWQGRYDRYYTENPANAVGREVTEEIIRSGNPGLPYRVEVQHKDGGTRWLEVSKQAYKTDGRVSGIIGVARDVTDRVRREAEREQIIVDLQEGLDSVRTLKEVLTICASCKKIRDEQGVWSQIESYIRQHTGTEFTHSICTECAHRLYPELYSSNGKGKN